MEVWMPDKELGKYDISSKGRIRNRRTQRVLSTSVDSQGDEVVYLYDGEKKVKRKVNRLVAEHHINNNITGIFVKHKNGNKTDNRVENLYLQDASIGKRIMIEETRETFNSITECSKVTGISKTYLSKCINYPFCNSKKQYHFKIIE